MTLARYLLFILALSFSDFLYSQPLFITKSGKISFFSRTPLEDIKAVNKKVYSSIHTETGSIQFLLNIAEFSFKYAAMQKHFNDEDYMHTEKYPNASFKGTIVNKEAVNLTTNGTYKVMVEGELTMHGVTNKVRTSANIIVREQAISANTVFYVRLEDYKIKAPKIVIKKIAEVVEITVDCEYQPFKN